MNMFYTTAEVAAILGVHKETVRRWVRAGWLMRAPVRARHGRWVFAADVVAAFVKGGVGDVNAEPT